MEIVPDICIAYAHIFSLLCLLRRPRSSDTLVAMSKSQVYVFVSDILLQKEQPELLREAGNMR